MSTTESLSVATPDQDSRISRKSGTASLLASAKVHGQNLERLAIVYVRQSTPQQVTDNRESLLRQYAFRDRAVALGWDSERILVIDQDLGLSGRSADNRLGFQHLLSEVTLDHVGIVLGLEMSRLARSSKDWHHLFELCGIFGTLLADDDGVYDPNDPNDRLVLGLKGIMSEIELLTMRNRLERGKLNKAQRGELYLHVPVGYVKTTTGGIALDPDEQVRTVVHLIFDKFDELGSGQAVFRYLRRHGIQIGIRPIDGPNRGQLEWRRASKSLVFSILHHPFYAGAYGYGRCPVIPKRKQTHKVPRKWVPPEQWKVLLHDCTPAYISSDRYVANQLRLKENQSGWETKCSIRDGAALLSGMVVCGQCGRRLATQYGRGGHPRYVCVGYLQHLTDKKCAGVSGQSVDALVTQQVFRALEPAGIELCVHAVENIHSERERLATHWKQQIERAQYEARKAERQYRAVDSENRLVARTLEQEWEIALSAQRRIQEDFDRFEREKPMTMSAAEQEQIRALADEIPVLWQASSTSAADRKEIVRCLIERVVVNVRGETEHVDVTIHWVGGFVSQHVVIRPVSRFEQLEDYDRLKSRIMECRTAGLTARQIAVHLNKEGFSTPTVNHSPFTKNKVNELLAQFGMGHHLLSRDSLGPNEWWISELASELKIQKRRLHHWIQHGFVHATKRCDSKFWILWADEDELTRLRQLRDHYETDHRIPYPAHLTQPKNRGTTESTTCDTPRTRAKTTREG